MGGCTTSDRAQQAVGGSNVGAVAVVSWRGVVLQTPSPPSIFNNQPPPGDLIYVDGIAIADPPRLSAGIPQQPGERGICDTQHRPVPGGKASSRSKQSGSRKYGRKRPCGFPASIRHKSTLLAGMGKGMRCLKHPSFDSVLSSKEATHNQRSRC